jgi:hypothetical protein
MNLYLRIGFLLVLSAGTISAAEFEGDVDYEMRQEGEKPSKIHYQIKPPRMRVNMGSDRGNMTMIIHPTQKTVYMLMDEEKMAMKQVLKDERIKEAKSTIDQGEFIKTGKIETIAGRKCEVYTYKDQENEGEVCNASGMGAFYLGGQGQPASTWEREARAKGMFPLRTTVKSKKKGQAMTLIATRIQEKKLPASLFEVPEDYQVMDMSVMGDMMMKGYGK